MATDDPPGKAAERGEWRMGVEYFARTDDEGFSALGRRQSLRDQFEKLHFSNCAMFLCNKRIPATAVRILDSKQALS